MNVIHRRSRIGRFAWSGLVVLALLLLVVARQQEQAALTRQIDEAQRRAVLYANTVLYNALRAPTVATPLTGATYRDLFTDIQGQIFTDTRVARVRLWSSDGVLLFSTDDRDKIGELRVDADPAIMAADGGEVSSRLTTAPFTKATTGDPGTLTELFQTFVPLRVPDRVAVLGSVQIDQFYAALRSDAAGPWKTAQAIFGAMALIAVLLAAWSFRRRPVSEPAPASGSTNARELEHAAHAEEITRRNGELEHALEALHAEVAATNAATVAASSAAAAAEREAAGGRAAETQRKLSEASVRLEDSDRRAAQAELRMREVGAELAASQRATEDAMAEAAASRNASTADAQALVRLEARVVAAEARAAEAERRLAELRQPDASANGNGHLRDGSNGHHEEEPPAAESDREPHEMDDLPLPISAEANELRARLTRSAARKKHAAE
ncbi:MAG: hypothetical protein ABI572_06805 [Actinomycetota bacterium]